MFYSVPVSTGTQRNRHIVDCQAITIAWSGMHQLKLDVYTFPSLFVPSTMVKSSFTDYSVTHRSLTWNKKTSNKSLSLRITSDSFTGYFVTKGRSRLASEQAQFRLDLFQVRKRTLHTFVYTMWHPSKNLVTEFSKFSRAILYLAWHVWDTTA